MPRAELQPHFRCVWRSVLPASHSGSIAVVPDGCVDVLWRPGRLLVVGPDITAARPELGPGAVVLGARFQPGAAMHWLGLPMSEIVGCEIDLSELWGHRARTFAARMAEAGAASADVFQRELARLAPRMAAPDREAAAIFGLVQGSAGRPGGSMALLMRRLGLSERTLRRRCTEHFGYGAKTLERILRFQRALALARARGEGARGDLAALAADAGYADQAHLSREMQALCGMTATAVLREVLG